MIVDNTTRTIDGRTSCSPPLPPTKTSVPMQCASYVQPLIYSPPHDRQSSTSLPRASAGSSQGLRLPCRRSSIVSPPISPCWPSTSTRTEFPAPSRWRSATSAAVASLTERKRSTAAASSCSRVSPSPSSSAETSRKPGLTRREGYADSLTNNLCTDHAVLGGGQCQRYTPKPTISLSPPSLSRGVSCGPRGVSCGAEADNITLTAVAQPGGKLRVTGRYGTIPSLFCQIRSSSFRDRPLHRCARQEPRAAEPAYLVKVK
jgi:hypothetical protein